MEARCSACGERGHRANDAAFPECLAVLTSRRAAAAAARTETCDDGFAHQLRRRAQDLERAVRGGDDAAGRAATDSAPGYAFDAVSLRREHAQHRNEAFWLDGDDCAATESGSRPSPPPPADAVLSSAGLSYAPVDSSSLPQSHCSGTPKVKHPYPDLEQCALGRGEHPGLSSPEQLAPRPSSSSSSSSLVQSLTLGTEDARIGQCVSWDAARGCGWLVQGKPLLGSADAASCGSEARVHISRCHIAGGTAGVSADLRPGQEVSFRVVSTFPPMCAEDGFLRPGPAFVHAENVKISVR